MWRVFASGSLSWFGTKLVSHVSGASAEEAAELRLLETLGETRRNVLPSLGLSKMHSRRSRSHDGRGNCTRLIRAATTSAMKDELLKTYLNDHLAGAEAGIQLAEDCLARNPEGPLGDFLAELVTEIKEDHRVLKDLHDRVPGRENTLKKMMAWMLSKASRLKLENLLLQYTDLTRLEELEGLLLGVRGKLALWEVLEAACASDERFNDIDFQELQQRAQLQLERIEHHRLEEAKKAFSGTE